MQVRAIAIVHVDKGKDQITKLRKFHRSDISNGKAYDWATRWARSVSATHVIVCTPENAHRFLSPIATIALA